MDLTTPLHVPYQPWIRSPAVTLSHCQSKQPAPRSASSERESDALLACLLAASGTIAMTRKAEEGKRQCVMTLTHNTHIALDLPVVAFRWSRSYPVFLLGRCSVAVRKGQVCTRLVVVNEQSTLIEQTIKQVVSMGGGGARVV